MVPKDTKNHLESFILGFETQINEQLLKGFSHEFSS